MLSMIQSGQDMVSRVLYVLLDTLNHEPIELLRFPAVDPTKLERPVLIAANDGAVTVNKINTVSNTVVRNVLLPAASAEGDIFVLVNQTPRDLTLKVAAADISPVATLRPGAQMSMRYVGGSYMAY